MNSSEAEREWTRQQYSIAIPVLLGLSGLSMLTNSCLLLTMLWVKGPLSATLRLTISLMISDMWTSLVVAVSLFINSYLAFVYGVHIRNPCVPLAFECVRLGGLLTATLHLLVLAFNHYLSIVSPFRYRKLMNTCTTTLVIASLWVVPFAALLAYSMPMHTFTDERCMAAVMSHHTFQFRLAIFVIFTVLLVLMLAIYGHIFIVLYRLEQQLKGRRSSSGNRSENLKRKRSTVSTALLIVVTFLFGWMPSSVWFVLFCPLRCAYTQLPLELRFGASIFIITMILLKTLINPIVYAVRIPEIRDSLSTLNAIVLRCCKSPTSHYDSINDRTLSIQNRFKANGTSKLMSTCSLVTKHSTSKVPTYMTIPTHNLN